MDISKLSAEEIRAVIRERRAVLDAKIASGEVVVRHPLTYDKKGPSIRGGPEGWGSRPAGADQAA